MNYREAVQNQIVLLERLYDNAGGLRDASSGSEEKDAWNEVRSSTRKLSTILQKIDNNMQEGRGLEELRGTYI